MKIAFFSTPQGGVDTYALEAGLWLTQHGHTVHILYMLNNKMPERLPERYRALHLHRITVSRADSYLLRLERRIAPLKRWHMAIHEAVRARTLASAAARIHAESGLDFIEVTEGIRTQNSLGGVPFIVRMHGAEWVFRRYCEDARVERGVEAAQRRLMLAARQRHTVSRAYATYIAGACNVPAHTIDLIRYPTDFSQFPLREPPPQKPPFHLMTVGRLQKRKGVHTLIAALPKVWAVEPETYLHLYGGEADFGRTQIDAAIPPDVQRGRIIIEGFVDHETLIGRYADAHVYVGPTRFESSGLHLQEAMAAGRPVIASDVGPIPEFVRHGETGWLVPRDDADALADAILTALRNPDQREAFAREGRRLAERMFDIEQIMTRQMALYQRDF
jgi:glycosyltransferase involved in cell wall biosynthesis